MTIEEIKESMASFQKSGRRVKMMSDFEESIQIDHAHIQGLEQLLAAQLAYFENEDWTQFSEFYVDLRQREIQVEVNDLKERILLQKKNLADKIKHFDEVFYPMYSDRLKKVTEDWQNIFKRAKAVHKKLTSEEKLGKLDSREKRRNERIAYYLDEWGNLPRDEQENVEIQANYYSIFENLLPKE